MVKNILVFVLMVSLLGCLWYVYVGTQTSSKSTQNNLIQDVLTTVTTSDPVPPALPD